MRHRYLSLILALAVLAVAWGVVEVRQASAPAVADVLGCEGISSSHPQAGLTQQTCTYQGDRLIVWSFTRGTFTFDSPAWVNKELFGSRWWIGCARADDCLTIKGQVGGDLVPGGGSHSLVVQ